MKRKKIKRRKLKKNKKSYKIQPMVFEENPQERFLKEYLEKNKK